MTQRLLALLGLVVLVYQVIATIPNGTNPALAQPLQVGTMVASFYGYGDSFHGRKTASGERFDRNALTAAHKDLPLGTVLQVGRIDRSQWVVVRINDRGPYVKGRDLDLSYDAAHAIGIVRAGVKRVRYIVLHQ